MKPFLLLNTRPEDEVAEADRRGIAKLAGLSEDGLHMLRLDREPLGVLELTDWSGLILGGSPFNVSDPAEKKTPTQQRIEREICNLLDEVVEKDFPFLGACYGIGTLGTHQGGTVDRQYGEHVAVVPVTLTTEGRTDPVFACLPDIFGAIVGHKEALSVLPDRAVLLATGQNCPIQAFRVGANLYATQFHCEADAEMICHRMEFYQNHGYFTPGQMESTQSAVRAGDSSYAPGILRAFVRRFSA